MRPARTIETELPFDPHSLAENWIGRLSGILDDPNRHSDFMSLAESAVAACPGHGDILSRAATCALLDRQPDKALVYLKRISKRYEFRKTEHLLHALALFQKKRFSAARDLLEAIR